MLILLTHANHLFSDRKQVRKMQPYAPLQTLVAASVLREAGFDVAFADMTFDRDIRRMIETLRPGAVAVCEDNFNFLTKMCLLENRRFACEIAQTARAYGARAIVNSSDATDNPQLYLEGGFDSVILGELEAALPGACRNGRGISGPHRRIENLDALPLPAWDLLDAAPYRDAWTREHGYFSMNLAASRGCPYRCNWCAKPIFGSAYRHVTPKRAALEMARLKATFHPDRLWWTDDIFGLSAKWLNDFAHHVERDGCGIPFKIQSRCDLMTRDMVQALRRAGCYEVWMGAESGSQRILDSMEKGIRVEQIYHARENLGRHGIRACYFLQFGYLGEAWEDVESTIRVVRETRPDDIGVSVSYPLPNTRFHQIVKAGLPGRSNWTESGDLELMYEGAFSSDFYRALAEALHLELRPAADSRAIQNAWDEVDQLRCVSC